jgi:putative flavoprotein involved in K+ transport
VGVTGASARPVTVVGAGPAGLAVAACLRRRGIGGTVLERGDGVGESWRHRYERLHLHTPRVQSHLPGYRIPRRFGRWVARGDLVDYLEAYAAYHRIAPVCGVDVSRLDRDGAGWRLTTSDGERHARSVVVATGYNNVPYLPDWPGRHGFAGVLLHASDYRRPEPYLDADVLVVGTGNTGAEIAAELAERGARRVRLAVRTPPHVVPRTLAGLPTTLLGIANEYTPTRIGDPVNALLQRLTIGDLSPHGLPTPADGLIARYRATDQVPIIDVGLVEQLRAGRVEPVAAVESFESDGVVLTDGKRIRVGVVIAATGYRTGLERIVGHLGTLDGRGRPTTAPGTSHPSAPGLYFVGLRNPLIGLLNAIRFDAERVARSIAAELAVPPTSAWRRHHGARGRH